MKKSIRLPILSSLAEKIEKTTITNEPQAELELGDHVIGTLDDDLMQMWSAWFNAEMDFALVQKTLRRHEIALETAESVGALAEIRAYNAEKSPEVKRAAKELERLSSDARMDERDLGILKRVFIRELQARYPETIDKEIVGIAKGWQVFWSQQPYRNGGARVLVP